MKQSNQRSGTGRRLLGTQGSLRSSGLDINESGGSYSCCCLSLRFRGK